MVLGQYMTRRQAKQVCAAACAVAVGRMAAVACAGDADASAHVGQLVARAHELQCARGSGADIAGAQSVFAQLCVCWYRLNARHRGAEPLGAVERMLCNGCGMAPGKGVACEEPVRRVLVKYMVTEYLSVSARLHEMCACAEQLGVPVGDRELLDARIRRLQTLLRIGSGALYDQFSAHIAMAVCDIADVVDRCVRGTAVH